MTKSPKSVAFREVADELGVSLRTVQRRCERGLIPGAYRTKKGGHYKINLNRWRKINRFIKDPANRRAMTKGQAAFEFTLVAEGISEDDLKDSRSLKQRDYEKYTLVHEMPYRVHPRAYEALERQDGALILKAEKVRLNYGEVTLEALARELDVSVRTLYRTYGAKKLRQLCPITRHRKPKIESGNLHNLAA